jgi:OOP family OmpA-OmpF porin
MAQEAGWYLGLGAGETRARIDNERINNDLLGVGLATTAIQKEESSTGYKIFAGYKANPNFAIEGGYFDLGDFGFTSTTTPAGTLRGNLKLQGFNLDLVGIMPITSRFSANARIGVNYADTVDSFSGTGAVHVLNPSPSARESNLKIGMGLQYAISDAWSVRADLERYRINDAVGNHGDIDHLSMALVYSFGEKTPEPKPVARMVVVAPPPPPPLPPPLPVYVAPAPAPVLMAPAKIVPPPRRKVSFSSDSLFDFDSAVVKPGGKSALDTFVKELQGVTFDVITVTGHSDRIGKHDYNMLLSQRRAQAVSNYLIDTGGLPATKISSVGVDGASPVTTIDQCRGVKPSKAMIDCLAPDRRVEVEVTGTQ